MFALLLAAVFFLAVSAFMFFGAPYLFFGRAGLSAVCRRPEARVIGGGLGLAAAGVAMAPLVASALAHSGDKAYLFAATLSNLSFGM